MIFTIKRIQARFRGLIIRERFKSGNYMMDINNSMLPQNDYSNFLEAGREHIVSFII